MCHAHFHKLNSHKSDIKRIGYNVLFHLANWGVGISIWYDVKHQHYNFQLVEKFCLSLLMILFYSFKATLFTANQFYKQRENLMKNKIIKEQILKAYTDSKGKSILTEEEVYHELLIDRAINFVSHETIYDEQLLKLKFLKNDEKYQ